MKLRELIVGRKCMWYIFLRASKDKRVEWMMGQ